MNLSKFKFVILIAFSILLLPIHVLSKRDTRKTRGDNLVIGDIFEPTIINPILTHSSISAVLKRIIFDGLIKLNEKMEPVPHLALSWENSPDGVTWIFHLRRDVKFHDGTKLMAQDVKFTFDKVNDPSIKSPYLSIFRNIKAVRARDRHTVEIHLKNPFPSFLFYLDVGILPKHLLVEKDLRKAEFNYHPIGTGPFKMQRWSEDEIMLKANEDYFKGKPHLSQVIVRSFNDQQVIWAELMKGTVDCVFLTSPRNYDVIERVPNFKVYSFLDPYYYIVAFNEKNIYFGPRITRQALNYAVDKERIVAKVLRGRGQVSAGPIYPQTWGYSRTIEPYPYDPKKAAELLAKAGWKDTNGNHVLDKEGREFEFLLLVVQGDDIFRGCALLIQQQLLDIGIRMTVRPIPFSAMYEKFLSTKRFDAALLTMISDDPDKNYLWWHSSQIDGGFNVFSYRNKKVNELLDRGRTTMDSEERREIYYQFQREIREDPPGVLLFWRDYLIGIHKRFRGVRFSPAGILNNINEWYVPKGEQKHR